MAAPRDTLAAPRDTDSSKWHIGSTTWHDGCTTWYHGIIRWQDCASRDTNVVLPSCHVTMPAPSDTGCTTWHDVNTTWYDGSTTWPCQPMRCISSADVTLCDNATLEDSMSWQYQIKLADYSGRYIWLSDVMCHTVTGWLSNRAPGRHRLLFIQRISINEIGLTDRRGRVVDYVISENDSIPSAHNRSIMMYFIVQTFKPFTEPHPAIVFWNHFESSENSSHKHASSKQLVIVFRDSRLENTPSSFVFLHCAFHPAMLNIYVVYDKVFVGIGNYYWLRTTIMTSKNLRSLPSDVIGQQTQYLWRHNDKSILSRDQ